jgi:dTDP-4-dehydrorhamnose 3,5-epimerase
MPDKSLIAESKIIPGLFKIDMLINVDSRGSFTELYQEEKLHSFGLPKLKIVQTNLSVNNQKGTLRGLHAEPWNKYITPLKGQVFVAIADIRADNFGKCETFELKFGQAIFVPRGCANSYLTLTKEVFYLYQVDAHWQAGQKYPSVHVFDPDLNIKWPMQKDEILLSEKDSVNPSLAQLKKDMGI